MSAKTSDGCRATAGCGARQRLPAMVPTDNTLLVFAGQDAVIANTANIPNPCHEAS